MISVKRINVEANYDINIFEMLQFNYMWYIGDIKYQEILETSP